jgi:hypothetical protein
VELNVGGQYFTTALDTLTQQPGSMLAAMFSGAHSIIVDPSGTEHLRSIRAPLRVWKSKPCYFDPTSSLACGMLILDQCNPCWRTQASHGGRPQGCGCGAQL